jgi:hypothetical protein
MITKTEDSQTNLLNKALNNENKQNLSFLNKVRHSDAAITYTADSLRANDKSLGLKNVG